MDRARYCVPESVARHAGPVLDLDCGLGRVSLVTRRNSKRGIRCRPPLATRQLPPPLAARGASDFGTQ